jgi:hypothetical protein
LLKKTYFFGILSAIDEKTGSGPGPGSVSQWYKSADPDPHQPVTLLQHCVQVKQDTTYDDKNEIIYPKIIPKKNEIWGKDFVSTKNNSPMSMYQLHKIFPCTFLTRPIFVLCTT